MNDEHSPDSDPTLPTPPSHPGDPLLRRNEPAPGRVATPWWPAPPSTATSTASAVPPPPLTRSSGEVEVQAPARRRTRQRVWAPIGIAGLSLVAGAGGGWYAAGRNDSAAAVAISSPAAANVSFTGANLSVAEVLAKLAGSVVSVDSQVTQRRGPLSRSGEAAGTGIVYDTDGHIVTNAHVVAGATRIEVTLNGETTSRTATLVATDVTNDLALLKVSDATGLVPATFGASADAQVGDQVVAVGNALALAGGLSVTEGIVSAVDRSIETDTADLTGLIQTDAAISSGNSGGPLVEATGKVIGINTAVAASSGNVNAANIGFAIPIDHVRTIVDAMIADAD